MRPSTQKYLQQHNPTLLERMLNQGLEQFSIKRIGEINRIFLKYNGQEIALESLLEPIDQAKRFYKQHELSKYERVVFIGVGGIATIEAALSLNPLLRYDIVFINFEEAKAFFEVVDTNKKAIRNMDKVYILEATESIMQIGQHIADYLTHKTLLIIHPALSYYFAERIREFQQALKKGIDNRGSNLQINNLYQKQWVLNTMINFVQLMNTPNVFRLNESIFKGKTVVLVAAGPSLEYEIEELRSIIEEDSAYVVALGSSINAMLKNDLRPHIICTYDPSVLNIKVYEQLIQSGIEDIPMLFGSTTAEDVIRGYKGPKVHYITGQDTLLPMLLKEQFSDNEIIFDAPVISILALNLFSKLGVGKIALVGQNFAFHNKQWYAKGIEYSHFTFDENQMTNSQLVKSVDGEDIRTDDSLLRSLRAMEVFIKSNQLTGIINTTVGGAYIEGTEYLPLSEIRKGFEKQTVSKTWYKSDANSYNYSEIQLHLESLKNDYQAIKESISSITKIVNSLSASVEKNNLDIMKSDYSDFEKVLLVIENNSFYKTIMLPMDRVRRDYLSKKAKQVNYNKNLSERIVLMQPEYERFVASLIFIMQQYGVFYDLFFQQSHKVIEELISEKSDYHSS